MKEEKPKSKFINREISWLSFNGRVLQEAADPNVPAIERLRFLGIFSNNLDEFFRVRVATLRRMQNLGKQAKAFIGESPKKVLREINEIVLQQREAFSKNYHAILSDLAKEHIYLLNETEITQAQGEFVKAYFDKEVRPHLIPILLNPKIPFPYLTDKFIYLAIKMSGVRHSPTQYALAEIPSDLDRFVLLPSKGNKKEIILLDDIIRYNLSDLFPVFNFREIKAYTIKVTRDAELDMDDDLTKSFMEKLSKSLKLRKKGDPVRFIYDSNLPRDFLKLLTEKLNITKEDTLVKSGRYHNFKDFIGFPNYGRAQLENQPLKPTAHPQFKAFKNTFEAIKHKDILLHYPYQTFDHFIEFLRESAIDPKVTSIKITIYRLASSSRIINSLISAARNGKNVKVVIELRARFDEAANIKWSQKLEDVGIRVIPGVPGLKVHSKMCLVTRKEDGHNVHYAKIATGNFNEKTARIYTDHGLFTANKAITSEVNKVFSFFESTYKVYKFKNLVVSPRHMRPIMLQLINQEIKLAKQGQPASILIKVNNLLDEEMIDRLYAASNAGVKIQLLVRGVCSLKAGVPGLSENIEAYSVVDRFLEHSRIYVFGNGGQTLYYLSSADLMTRNIDYRVEVTCPVLDPDLQQELQDMLDIQLADNVKSRVLGAEQNNAYHQTKNRKIRSQLAFYKYIEQKSKK